MIKMVYITCDTSIAHYNVMYGSAICSFIPRVYGYKVTYVVGHHDTQCSPLGSLVFAHLGGIGEIKMQLKYI